MLKSLAGLSLLSVAPCYGASVPYEIIRILAGTPVDPLPPEILEDLATIASRLGDGPINPQALARLVREWPPAQAHYARVLHKLYGRNSPLAWEAIPFASRPGHPPLQPPRWDRPPR